MNTKEAIEKLSNQVCFDKDFGFVNDEVLIELDTLEASEIIALLKRGEKYEAMWEDLEKAFKPMSSFFIGGTIWANIDVIKQKYFPKEESCS